MSPCMKIEREIIRIAYKSLKQFGSSEIDCREQEFIDIAANEATTEGAINDQWCALLETDAWEDYVEEFRNGGERTEIEPDYSRHYASESRAARLFDGTWVGWTRFFGGGKHGQPSEMPWMENAYEVEMTEKMAVVREFKRKEQ